MEETELKTFILCSLINVCYRTKIFAN